LFADAVTDIVTTLSDQNQYSKFYAKQPAHCSPGNENRQYYGLVTALGHQVLSSNIVANRATQQFSKQPAALMK